MATYDKESQEFILHSPDEESAKWYPSHFFIPLKFLRWVGNLGKHATHAVVAAQLYLDNKNYGLHWFVVQIRNVNNHLPMPGDQVGDIGLKGLTFVDFF